MFKFNNYSIKTKLISTFIVFKIIPLSLLFALGVFSFIEMREILYKNSADIIKKSQASVKRGVDLAVSDSIKSLDKKSRDMLEYKTFSIANRVADFLKKRDNNILSLSKQHITKELIEKYYNQKNRKVHVSPSYYYDENNEIWTPKHAKIIVNNNTTAQLKDNVQEFHKVDIRPILQKTIPIYKEITYYDTHGQEIYKVSSIDSNLKDISNKKNTYCKAEEYFKESLKLKKGEIYVSKVIGAYIGSPVIGSFTRTKASEANIEFEPQKYGYAGVENPVGKKFEGIVRFVTPVFVKDELQGYLSLALDHHHIMDFTDFVDPLNNHPLDISDASKGNYAFMWSSDFKSISHPRDYSIVGYDPKTGEMVPGWIDASMAKSFEKSGEKSLTTFLEKQPIFLNQSLDKKPNMAQKQIGQVGIDCRYINFAPQCQGWSQITDSGSHGSFVIYWSKVWKLTAAAAIPYYTGQYGSTKRGFGFVTMGSNIEEFHEVATKTKKNIENILVDEKESLKADIVQIIKEIFVLIREQINILIMATLLLLIIVLFVAIHVSDNISNRINEIIIATKKIGKKEFGYRLDVKENDEIGQLKHSFNTMAESIQSLTNDLEEKLFLDDLTSLKNRRSFLRDVKNYTDPELFLLDIDSFKNINDYYGIEAGNFILIKFGSLLREFCYQRDAEVYRMGSDEYLLLREIREDYKSTDEFIDELAELVQEKHFIDKELNVNATVSFTCGISSGEGNLLEKADLALIEAARKKVSFMTYSSSNPYMNRHKENILWKEKIIYAIENDMVVPFFQEIVDVKNPENKKYESLIRIVDNDRVISPYFFLDIAKETKLYPELTKIMVEKSFKIFDKKDATFSVNLSIDDITNTQTVAFIHEKLKEYDVKDKLTFELLESEEISNFDDILPFVKEMQKLGVKFAIDDFGSGYSNFSYLLKIKPDIIKIDGLLIKNLTHSSSEYHIVDAIVKFTKSLDMKIVAEHVSSQEIVNVLGDFDIDFMQGYHFGEPNPKLS